MEADQRGRSECNVGESNESTISASADGSVDLRYAFGTVFNTRATTGHDGACKVLPCDAKQEECPYFGPIPCPCNTKKHS